MSRTTTPSRRAYDSPVRRARAEQTRERIVRAGAELVRAASVRDWRGVTVRAVALRAGVNERTVYRHFATERDLRDAVMQQLEHDAGIDLETMTLDDVGDVAARIAGVVAASRTTRRRAADPTLDDAGRRQHAALLAAVAAESPGLAPAEQRRVAALLDVLWSVSTYEHLVVDWDLDHAEAVAATAGLIDLLVASVRGGAADQPG